MNTVIEAPVAAPVEVVTPIGPREALRLGRLVRPARCTGRSIRGQREACAIGAMAVAWGFVIEGDEFETFHSARLRLDEVYGGISEAIWELFDETEHAGNDGDAAVLAYLESRGL